MLEKSPETIALERIEEAYLTHATELDLSMIGEVAWVSDDLGALRNVPKEIGKLSNLIKLDLGGNRIRELPNELWQLKNLKSLVLRHNKLSDLSARIGQMKNLRTLDLTDNRLTELPETIGKLTKLVELDLTNNKFTKLPEVIGELSNLISLEISMNSITAIPTSIFALKKLENLSLGVYYYENGGNHIKVLPSEIGQLVNLKSIRLANNELKSLPREMLLLKSLNELDVRNNKISFPPEIVEKIDEPQFILNYYFSIADKSKRSLNEIKLLVVGQGAVGKTSLVQRIVYDSFNQEEQKTEGISIKHLDFEQNTKIEANFETHLNIWDFGGQEIMHATHQFFLTKRSLYLLVLDSRLTQEENRVEYWLKIIQSFGGESPVLIVGNKIDQHPLDIDRTGLQKKYPNIVGILETSAATGAGIESLKAAITEQVNHLPHVRDLLPETWFTVKTKLEELGKQSNFITQEKYIELCAENEVGDETSQRTLIGFLHDLGVVLHFQDDPRLEALGILNPQWVTNGVYKILNSHTLFQNKGILTISMLDEILNLPEYPRGKRLFIVDMMKKFELCYDIEPDKTFLVPDLLPKDEPTTDGREKSLAFQYHYAVLPSSVITRFIVRMNEYAQDTVWRSGVVLKDGGNTALVKADTEDRKIFIWVGGNEHKRHDFLTKIRGQFDAIHKTISKLEVKEMVPVPGHPEADPVDYDLLLQMDHNNVEVYPVLSGGRMIVVNVREMLSGVARQEDRQRGNVTNFYIGGDVKDSTIISGDENEVNK
ncbi:MAG: GTP-binding protein [Chloroflexi bacterium HGW-Chloroflexi-6]|nr:MAG: GTP-binding protein [Chloroflexi bacterium HGW-Chloroflexi-6]